MKTIKQIADEIGVSKQAVFYRIKKEPLSNTLQSLVTNKNGVLMVSFDGEKLIKQAFKIDTVKMFDDKDHQIIVKESSKENDIFDNEIIKLLQENMNVLQKQLEIKDKQIEELTLTVRTQAESINADRKNDLAGTLLEGHKLIRDITPVREEENQKKKGFFKNLFGK